MKTLLTFAALMLLSSTVHAGIASSAVLGQRDRNYEAFLRMQGAVDEPMTPRKALRLLRGVGNEPDSASADFQPVVKIEDGHYRVVATFAYKF